MKNTPAESTKNSESAHNNQEYSIDKLDQKIILELQEDARKPYKLIAAQLNVSDATIGQRVKNMVSRGILKLEARVNPIALPNKVAALVMVNVNDISIIDELKKLQDQPYVTSVWTGTGPYSVFIEVMVDSLKELNTILFESELKEIKGIIRTETFILLDSKTKFFKLAAKSPKKRKSETK